MIRIITAIALLASPASADGLRYDHKLHIAAGSATYAGARLLGASPVKALGWCAAAGAAKEVYDSTGRGNVEASDLAATILPCAVAALVEHAIGADKPAKIRRKPAPKVTRDERRDIIAYANGRN